MVVTGKDGKPVQGLHKEDFLAAEDGRPQNIAFFEEHAGTQPVRAASLPTLPPNVFINIPRMTPTDAVTVLLLDSLNTELQNQNFVRAQMLKYLKVLQPGGRMAIFALGTRLHLIQGLTDDPAILTAVLSNLKSGAGPQTSPLLEPKAEKEVDRQIIGLMAVNDPPAATALRQFFAEQSASKNDLRVTMTLEAFQEIAHYLAGIPGRKNLVWFSSAFSLVLFPDPELGDSFAVTREYGEKVKKTDALLAEAQVAVYPMAAEGLATDSIYDPAIQLTGVTSAAQAQAQLAEIHKGDVAQRIANHTTMDEIARDTGGEAIYNTNGLNDALARVEDNGSYYYTLSYTATNPATDGRFRKIRVKLASGNYKLAYRRGYYAADAKTLKAEATKPAADPLRPYMGSGHAQLDTDSPGLASTARSDSGR